MKEFNRHELFFSREGKERVRRFDSMTEGLVEKEMKGFGDNFRHNGLITLDSLSQNNPSVTREADKRGQLLGFS